MSTDINPESFDALLTSQDVARKMREISDTTHEAASRFWRVTMENPALSPRMKELVLFAMHAMATSLNVNTVERQVARALAAGATKAEIIDVALTISVLANHALYSSLPTFEEEWQAHGKSDEAQTADGEAYEAAKRHFMEVRGFWNNDRDLVAKSMPKYFAALTDLSTETWARGALSRKEREFICIAIDCTVTHTYDPGLRIHIRNAIREGATRQEILAIFQLAALMGLEGYVVTAEALAAQPA
tara:strand:+ start:30950 stop:31684 length:735 start_codon:yes stop_codon:yes gene_type:complete